MPEVDTLRGLAIFGVVLYHALYTAGLTQPNSFTGIARALIVATWVGRFGVNLFFVLSGFLITGILVDTQARPDYYRHFYIRRALRIVPVYLLILGFLFFSGIASYSSALLGLVYLSNLTPLFGIGIPYPVLWSLAVEEHFYMGWPWLAKKLNWKALTFLCLLIVVVSPGLRYVSYLHWQNVPDIQFQFNDFTWNSLDGLACGAALALLLRHVHLSRSQWSRISALLLGLGLAMWVAGLRFGILHRETGFGAAMQVVPWHLAFTGALLGFLLLGTSERKAWSEIRPLQYLAKISYGLYLVHPLVFHAFDSAANSFAGKARLSDFAWLVLRGAVASAFSIFIAAISRRYVEEPFLRLKDKSFWEPASPPRRLQSGSIPS